MKHTIIRREKEYGYDDCFLYMIFCSCGKRFSGWIIEEIENDFRRHQSGAECTAVQNFSCGKSEGK